MGFFNKLKNNFANGGVVDDDQDNKPFQLANVPGANYLNDKQTDDSVEPESSPIDLVAGMGAGALTDAMLPEAGQILGNETGSLDLSALKKIIANSADDASGVVNPLNANTPSFPSVTGPNANALETQIRNRQIDAANRLRYQTLQNKLRQR